MEAQPPPTDAEAQQPNAIPPAAPSPENGDHGTAMPTQGPPRPVQRPPAPFANIFDSPVLLPMLTVSCAIVD